MLMGLSVVDGLAWTHQGSVRTLILILLCVYISIGKSCFHLMLIRGHKPAFTGSANDPTSLLSSQKNTVFDPLHLLFTSETLKEHTKLLNRNLDKP